jgi:hypothetical protein
MIVARSASATGSEVNRRIARVVAIPSSNEMGSIRGSYAGPYGATLVPRSSSSPADHGLRSEMVL